MIVNIFLIDQQVIDRAAVLAEHHTVEDTARLNAGNLVREYMIDESPGIGTAHQDFPHMGDIEHTDRAAHRIVLGDNAGIAYGHNEASERTHLSVQSDVRIVETGFLFHKVNFRNCSACGTVSQSASLIRAADR